MQRSSSLHTPPVRASPWKAWHSAAIQIIPLLLFVVEWLWTGSRTFTWLSVLGLLTALFVLIGHGVTGLWLGFLIDSRNKISLSRLQMVGWTLLILSGFLGAVLVNIDTQQTDPGRVTIAPDLWLLLGISTASLVGSPMILAAKKGRAASEEDKSWALEQLAQRAVDTAKVAIRGQVVMNQSAQAARLSDLFQGSETSNAGLVDLGKVQMFCFSLVMLFAYASALAQLFAQATGKIAALPELDPGMLALLGISHAGYLVNKALPRSESV